MESTQDEQQIQGVMIKDIIDTMPSNQEPAETDSDKHPLLDTPIRLYRKRWLMLILFSLVTASNAFIWISLSAITDLVEKYYSIKALLVDWLSLSFLLVPSVMAIPGTFILARLGLKLSIALPAGFHAIGTAVRIAGIGKGHFAYVAVGQFIASFGTIFILATPPQLAAVWFGDRERTSATTIGVLMNTFGISIGFLLSTMVVPDTNNINAIGDGIRDVLLVHCVYCIIVFILVLVFVKDAPPSPPSLSQALRHHTQLTVNTTAFFSSIATLFSRLNYVLITIAYSINFGVVFALPTLLNQMIKVEGEQKSYHIPEKSVGWVGFIGPLGGIAGSLIAGALLDRFKQYKLITCFSLFMSTLSILGFSQALFHSTNIYLIAFVFTFLCFFNFPYLGYGLDHIAEVSYPISEGEASAMPMILGNLCGFLQIYVFQLVIDSGYLDAVLYIFLGFEGVAFLLSGIARTDMNRHLSDRNI